MNISKWLVPIIFSLLLVSNAFANQAPVITSNGGGASASTSINENTTTVTTVTVYDADPGDPHTFSISGGVDQAKFNINLIIGISYICLRFIFLQSLISNKIVHF